MVQEVLDIVRIDSKRALNWNPGYVTGLRMTKFFWHSAH